MKTLDLSGEWQCSIPGITTRMILPGTLDENRIGFPDENKNQWHPDAEANDMLKTGGRIATRLTRRYSYEGPARISRTVATAFSPEERVFLECERARCLRLEINGTPVPDFVPPSISTPHVFEVTPLLTGEDEITLISDNSYPGLPHDDILYSSAATDETQTNWNGILGTICLRSEKNCFLHSIRVLPREKTLDVSLSLSAGSSWAGTLRLSCSALAEPEVQISGSADPGETGFCFRDLPLRKDAARWDEEAGILYRLTVTGDGLEEKSVRFGIRTFGEDGHGHLALNGRRFFLRGEANCCVFPETGHPPMTAGEWKEILSAYRAYGVNCMRFHSHVPPEAAFTAADETGMLMQPELSHWNPRNALETEESYRCYRTELEQTVRWLANHPSFVMLTLGNELCTGAEGHRRMNELLRLAKETDPTRMYANASNGHYGMAGCDAESDFYTSQSFYEHMIRATSADMKGFLNQGEPSADHDYDASMRELRKTWKKPVFSFEVGQYEVLPDFREINEFHGVTRPDNLEIIREKVRDRGLEERWEQYCEASGELSLLCYREEAEAALRTEELSGISLLSLQDFPGQGTALVGMMNSHLRPKPYDFARPERFRAFFTSVLPLALLPSRTWVSGREAVIPLRVANYGKTGLRDSLHWSVRGREGILAEGQTENRDWPVGLSGRETMRIFLPPLEKAEKLELMLCLGEYRNRYSLWVYPDISPVCPPEILEARSLSPEVLEKLRQGGKVYLSPDAVPDAMPQSIRTQFSTDFWSVGTFPSQPGGMGQLIDDGHPLFRSFPTEKHTDWQWHRMASQRAFVLPESLPAIVTEMDSYAYLRPMAQLLEVRCEGGSLMLSSMNLHQLQAFPECRALQDAVYRYMVSEDFHPREEMSLSALKSIVR